MNTITISQTNMQPLMRVTEVETRQLMVVATGIWQGALAIRCPADGAVIAIASGEIIAMPEDADAPLCYLPSANQTYVIGNQFIPKQNNK